MKMNKREKKGLLILLCIILLLPILNGIFKSKKDDDGPKLNGIFELTLGMTENNLRNIVDTTLLKEIEFEDILWCGKAIEEKKLKVLYLSRYVVDENFAIEDITLSFSEKKLYMINISKYNSKTEELLTQKYSAPKVSDEAFDEMSDTKEQLQIIKKEWQTDVSNNVCMSMQLTDLSGALVRYSLVVYDYKKEKTAHESVANYWGKFQQDMQTIQEYLNQPLIDKL